MTQATPVESKATQPAKNKINGQTKVNGQAKPGRAISDPKEFSGTEPN